VVVVGVDRVEGHGHHVAEGDGAHLRVLGGVLVVVRDPEVAVVTPAVAPAVLDQPRPGARCLCDAVVVPADDCYGVVRVHAARRRLVVVVVTVDELRGRRQARAEHTVVHDRGLDRVDVAQVLLGYVPLDVTRHVVVVVGAGTIGRCRVRLPVDVAHGALEAREVGRGHPVVAALVHGQARSGRRVEVAIVVLVEPVPPVEVILGEVRLALLAGSGPGAGHEHIALHRRHRAVGPAGAALL